MQSAPVSYYASASARRLGTVAWTPTARPLPESPRFAAALSRVETLEQLGMDAEARLQLDAIESAARESNANALAAGGALLAHDEAVRAVRLGRMVAGSSATDSAPRGDSRAYMLVYPLPHRDEVLSLSHENKLDPALVAAVIRQESSWNPRAVSVAGARGLMQIMPPVGQQIARSRGYPLWDPALLFDPDVNLELGTAHLSASLNEETNRVRALAAYNAGSSRVARWSRKHGTNDAEVFIERIPFAETRDYVKVVLRNAEIYRALYDLR
jgi:soluble lytic murein transglycosylase